MARSLLDDLGEEVTGIAAPVSVCMALTVVLVRILNPEGDTSSSSVYIASLAYDEKPTDSSSTKLTGALLNAIIFVAVVAAMTFVLFLLFYYGCYRIISGYMAFAVFNIFFFFSGGIIIQILQTYNASFDIISLAFLLFNWSVLGVLSMFFIPAPLLLKQTYVVCVGIITAYIFTFVPEWTSWVLLVMMAIYDLIAVLCPGGPLKLLVELATTRQRELPALIYEARPVGRPYQPGTWRQPPQSGSGPVGEGIGNPPEPRIAMARFTGHYAAAATVVPPQPHMHAGPVAEGRGAGGAAGDVESGSATGAGNTSPGQARVRLPGVASEALALGATEELLPLARALAAPAGSGDGVDAAVSVDGGDSVTGAGADDSPTYSARAPLIGAGSRGLSGGGSSSAGPGTEGARRLLAPITGGDSSARERRRQGGVATGGTHIDSGPSQGPHAAMAHAASTPTQQGNGANEDYSEDADGALGLPDSIKLGLGDFIFYSMLVGRAAMYDMTTVYACFLAILAGLGATLLLLAVYARALPALPISIALGVSFYFITRLALEPYLLPIIAGQMFY